MRRYCQPGWCLKPCLVFDPKRDENPNWIPVDLRFWFQNHKPAIVDMIMIMWNRGMCGLITVWSRAPRVTAQNTSKHKSIFHRGNMSYVLCILQGFLVFWMIPTWFSEDFRHISYIQHEAMDGIQPSRGWLGDTQKVKFVGGCWWLPTDHFLHVEKKHGPCIDDFSRFYLLKVKISICYPLVN